MGDRTTVRLDISTIQKDAVIQIMNTTGWEFYQEEPFNELTTFVFDEINYGELLFLGELLKQGIPYNQHWGAGGEYTAGSRYLRFTQDGLAVIQEVYEEDKNPDLVSLLDNINDHEVLKTLIHRHAAHTYPLPWDNQVEYGKRYQARQLIDPQELLTSNP